MTTAYHQVFATRAENLACATAKLRSNKVLDARVL